MRRIAVVIDPWDHPYNGTVVSTRRFVEALARAGFDVELLKIAHSSVSDPAAADFQQLSIPGFNRVINAMRAPLARPDRALIRSKLQGCQLLHVQYPFFLGYSAIREARQMGIPVVCSFHVQPENILQNIRLPSRALSGLLYRLFIRAFYARVDRVIAPSVFAAGLLKRHGLETPISVLSNGIPRRFFDVARKSSGRAGYRILSVGRLALEKQQETLLRAVYLSRHRHKIELVLAGVGPRQSHLKRLANRLQVNATIGWLSDQSLLELYGDADVFAHTGTIELEGMSVLEAMAAGNPVVVSDAPTSACAAMVLDPRSRFEKGNPADLAAHLDYWLDHDEEREAAGRANRRFAEGFSHDRTVERLVAIYDDVLGVSQIEEQPVRLTGTI